MRILNRITNKVIFRNVIYMSGFLYKIKKIINKKAIEDNEALIISPCNSVHMMFCKKAMDIVFVNDNNEVCYIQENLKPWEISKKIKSARYIIEMNRGMVKKNNIKLYNKIKIVADINENLVKAV